MRIGVLGPGTVGKRLASGVLRAGHEVRLGSWEAGNPRAQEWVAEAAGPASQGSFADAAEFGELGEQIQREFASAQVVKALNTVNAQVMVDPRLVPGSHTVFMCGNDEDAKRQVMGLLTDFGWPQDDVMDLGDITAARGMEMYLPLWLRLFATTGTPRLNVQVVRS